MEPDDTVYLMAVPFQEPTGTVAPSAGLSTEVPRDGSLVSQAVVYPMLSQRMGVHCGTNVLLPGDGDHEVTVRVGGTAVRRYGALAGPAGDSATATVPFAYRAAERDDIDDEQFDRTGARDAGVDGDETRFRPAPDPELGAHYGARLARRLTPASRSTSPHRSPATRGYETALLATDAPDTA